MAGTETEWEMNIFVSVSFGGGLDLLLVLCKELNSEWFERKKMLYRLRLCLRSWFCCEFVWLSRKCEKGKKIDIFGDFNVLVLVRLSTII